MTALLPDAAGRRRRRRCLDSTLAARRDPGHRYPADPPTVGEIVAVVPAAGDGHHARRLRGLIVVPRRAGLRIRAAPALDESDLDRRRGALLVRRGRGGRRPEIGMDEWAWEQLQTWIEMRLELPAGARFWVINGPTRAIVVTRVRARLPL